MANSILEGFYQVLEKEGYKVVHVENDPLDRCYPHKDAKLIEAFQQCDFVAAEYELSTFANGNQKLFLSPLLSEKIIEAQTENIFPDLIERSRFDILFDPYYTEEQKQLLLSIKDNNLPENCLSNKDKKAFVEAELKKDFLKEFSYESEVTLIWIAIMLKRPALVKTLLNAKKPADIYTPMNISSSKSVYENVEYIASLFYWRDKGVKYFSKELALIVGSFLDCGFSPSYVFGEYEAEFFSFLAVEHQNIELLKLCAKYFNIVPLNLAVSAETFPSDAFPNTLEEFKPLKKETFRISPLSLAVHRGYSEMVRIIVNTIGWKESFRNLTEDQIATLVSLYHNPENHAFEALSRV